MAALLVAGITESCVLQEEFQQCHIQRPSLPLSVLFPANPDTSIAMLLLHQQAAQNFPFCPEDKSTSLKADATLMPLYPAINDPIPSRDYMRDGKLSWQSYDFQVLDPAKREYEYDGEAVAMSSYLQKCLEHKDISSARYAHMIAANTGLDSSTVFCSQLIRAYAWCQCFPTALQVFGQNANSDVYMWEAIIAACLINDEHNFSLFLFGQLQEEGLQPGANIFSFLLRACSSLQDAWQGMSVYNQIVLYGFEVSVLVGNALIAMYSKCGRLKEAYHVFRRLPPHNVSSWNMIIAGYADHADESLTFGLFEELQFKGVESNEATFACMLKLCAKVGAIDYGMTLHDKVIRSGFEQGVFVGNSILSLYVKCRNMSEAWEVFNHLVNRDATSWATMLRGYMQQGDGLTVLELFGKMQDKQIKPNKASYVSILNACANLKDLTKGELIHNEIIKYGGVDTDIGGTLVDMYAKCRSLKKAREVFDGLSLHSVFVWNALLNGYAQEEENALSALELFEKMKQEGFKPNHITFLSILKACSHIGALGQSMCIHDDILKYGFDLNALLGNALIDMYCKCDGLKEANYVLKDMQRTDLASWGAMIAGYAQYADCKSIKHCLEAMHSLGLKLDALIFTCVLKACMYARRMDEGKQYFKTMQEVHGIVPTFEHYNCMIGLFGRLGHLHEAMDLLDSMPITTDGTGWMTLLNTCRSYGNVGIARNCFERVIQIDFKLSAGYVLMSHVYSDAGMFKDAKEVLAMKKSFGAWKKPGRAWVEVKNKVHEFLVGDKTHPQSDIVYAKLEEMIEPMKEQGYVPHLYDILKPMSIEDKEQALCGHSERLAIVFGILSTPEGTTIRVRKNLRVCNDCHNASKFISKIEKRQIVLRDAFRFHIFEDGECSCADFF